MLNIIQLPALENNYIYLLHEALSGETAVIDPGEASPVLSSLQQHHWTLKYLLNTHHHADHIAANIELQAQTHCIIAASAQDQHRIPGIQHELKAGDQLNLGDISIDVLDLRGHTLGHIGFYIPSADALFCGDTLFSMGCGRLFEGSAEQLWTSLQTIKQLPPQTKIYCAHEYTHANGLFALQVEPDNKALQQRMSAVKQLRAANLPTIPSLLSDELATNPFLREHSPSIQASLDMQGQSALSLFTQLRKLKDHF